MKKDQKALTKRSEDQAKWYTEVVQRAKLADYSPVRGCMVIRPYGYAIWERLQKELDDRIKASGVKNAYFPLLIPYSFLEREAEHVEGFAPEVAMVTKAGNRELEEPLVLRPTSETIIYEMFKDWIQSYRDLPLRINQWANVIRWEKRTSPFLRTTEFLWQEGHTAHKTKEEAEKQVREALEIYTEVVTEILGLHVIKGYKTEKEKFAGADYTLSVEALMRDGKALQSGTSHLLGQNFAKSFSVKFTDEDGTEKYVWLTSWGVSTRLIGGIILGHGDDNGLILSPRVAPVQVFIVPIFNEENKTEIQNFVSKVESVLTEANIRFETDFSNNTPGWKFSEGEMRGIPIRLEIGPKDVEKNSVLAVSRIDGEKESLELSVLGKSIETKLNSIQKTLYDSSKEFAESRILDVNSKDEFMEATKSHEGYIRGFFCGDKDEEKRIQDETKFTTRCMPLDTFEQKGECLFTGKEGRLTLFARAY